MANIRRPQEFFAGVYAYLLEKYAQVFSGQPPAQELQGADTQPKDLEKLLYMMDSTTITLFDNILKGVGRHPKPERGTATSDTKVFQDVPTLGSANRALKHMARKAGITKAISFHCSRHTFATLFLTAGSDIYTASKLLGHNDIHSTEIYANVVMEKKVDAVNLLNGIF